MSEWQPIETAPTDGTPILFGESGYREILFGYVVLHKERRLISAHDEFGDYRSPADITHWMPAPEPPRD